MINRALAAGAIVGPAVLTAAWLVLGFVSPGYTMWGTRIAPYSPISQPVSGLGLGPTGPFMNAAFIISGLLIVAGAVGIFQLIPEMESARWTATVLLALPGVGSVIDGIFTLEHFLPHTAGFVLVLTTVAGFPLVGWSLRREPSWGRMWGWLVVSGPLTLVLTIVYFLTFTPTVQGVQTGIAGLTERLLVVEILAWYVVLGWRAMRGAASSRSLAFN